MTSGHSTSLHFIISKHRTFSIKFQIALQVKRKRMHLAVLIQTHLLLSCFITTVIFTFNNSICQLFYYIFFNKLIEDPDNLNFYSLIFKPSKRQKKFYCHENPHQ